MKIWPEALPDFSLRQGYSEGFRQTVIRSEIKSGATKRRKRFTDSPKTLDIVIPLTGAEVNIFTSFYEEELKDGSLSFTKTHPRLGTEQTFSFKSDPEPLVADDGGGDTYILKMKLDFVDGFSPSEILGLTLWLDAADSSTITASNGLVSEWRDKSGKNNHAAQDTGIEQPVLGQNPINGRNTITFNEMPGERLLVPANIHVSNLWFNGATTIWVEQSRPAAFGNTIASPGEWTSHNSNDGAQVALGVSFTVTDKEFRDPFSSYSHNTPELVGITYDSANVSNVPNFYRNGLSVGFGGLPTPAGAYEEGDGSLIIGSNLNNNNPLNGEIAEVLIYDRILSASELSQINTYLSDKWGIPLS